MTTMHWVSKARSEFRPASILGTVHESLLFGVRSDGCLCVVTAPLYNVADNDPSAVIAAAEERLDVFLNTPKNPEWFVTDRPAEFFAEAENLKRGGYRDAMEAV